MKNYKLKLESATKLRKIGRINFTYDKAFMGKFDSYAKYVPCKITIFIYSNENSESVRADILKRYKNAREIEIIYE